MDHHHPHGKPISILRFSESKEVIIDNIELDKIFNHPEIQDRNVVILSLIGAFRGGKSFFLDYGLRFLYAHFPSINNKSKSTQNYFRKNDNWMGSSDEPLKGFSWRSGTKRETIGINIWSDVFLHTMERTGERIAIFVMDTQGLFDNESTPTDNSRIFALGTLISSIQVLNLKQQIQEDHLQYLHFATELAQFNAKKKGRTFGTPFQKLTFLIRDWENYEEFEFGPNGGKKYLEEVISSTSKQKTELRSVRQFIKNSFEDLECCLLPHPGGKVVGRQTYDGNWSDMDQNFRRELKNAIEHVLLPESMTLKKVNSQKLTVQEFKVYIEQYLKLFQSGDVPNTPTLYQSMLNSSMRNIITKCIDHYKSGINGDKSLTNMNCIPTVHKKWKDSTMKMYDDEHKMGDEQQVQEYRFNLDNSIELIYKEFQNFHQKRFEELEKQANEHRIRLEEERKRKEKAEQEKMQQETEFKKAQEKMERDIKEAKDKMERKMNEMQKENEEKYKALQKELEEKKKSFGHYAGKAVEGACMAVATPIVAVGAEAATVTWMVKGAFEDGKEGLNREGKKAFDATFGALGTAWKNWWES